MLKNPFQLEVFETYLYWSTKSYDSVESNTVLRMNKLGTGIPVNTLTNLIHPTGVKLYHKLRYDIGGRYLPRQTSFKGGGGGWKREGEVERDVKFKNI